MTPRTRSPRAGLTLVELLATIAIIGLLVGLLLPAVQSARESSRRMACSSNVRQLGQALNSFVAARSAYPGATSYCYRCKVPPTGAEATWAAITAELRTATGGVPESAWNWLTQLLPHLELQNVHDRLDFGQAGDSTAMQTVGRTVMPQFVCPSDPRASAPLFGRNNTMATWYIGSMGPVETNCYYASASASPTSTNSPYCEAANRAWCAQPLSDDQINIFRLPVTASGLFGFNFRGLPSARVADGLSNTIAIGETLPFTWRLYNAVISGRPPLGTVNIPINMPLSDKLIGDTGGINNNLAGTIRWTLCESQGFRSEHPMVANVAFCDGSVRALSATIDYRVQCALGTIRGSAQPLVLKLPGLPEITWADAVMVSDSDFR